MDHGEMIRAARSLRDTDKLRALAAQTSAAVAAAANNADPSAAPRPTESARAAALANLTPRRQPTAPMRGGWLAAGLMFAVALSLAGVLVADRTDSSVARRTERLSADVNEALHDRRALRSDVASIAALRSELNSQLHAGVPPEHLFKARAGVDTLEALLAVTRGEKHLAEKALRDRSVAADLPATAALRGALAALSGEPIAVEELSKALHAGFVRPELNVWRARARERSLPDRSAARAILADLKVMQQAPQGGLEASDRFLRVRALAALGDLEQANTALGTLAGSAGELHWEIALRQLETALEVGDFHEALLRLQDVNSEWSAERPGREASEGLAERALSLASPLLEGLRQGRLGAQKRRELVDLVHMASILRSEPLPTSVIETLLSAVDAASSGKGKRIPGEVCLALAAMGGTAVKRRVLVAVFRRLYKTRSVTEQGELHLLACLIVGANPSPRAPDSFELLDAVDDPEAQFEIYLARALAWETFGARWIRRALADLSRARKIRPDDPDVEALLQRLLKGLRDNPAQRERRPS
jgi:hypothetical protein